MLKSSDEAPKLPKATHKGILKIGDAEIPCAVLPDGKRVISEHGITQALGSRSGASKRLKKAAEGHGAPLPIFIAPSQLKPFISNELMSGPLSPIQYKDGRKTVQAYDATVLPLVCDVWLKAREAGALQTQQLIRAQQAEILMRGLAHVGIVALVDEATGFQAERERDALHRLLEAYLSEERLAWAKRFPDEFYKQIYRLKGWKWSSGKARTPFIGKITNNIVYELLPAGVLEELKVRNPTKPGSGYRQWKHHQFLSEDIGQPDLRDHLLQLIAIMKVSRTWDAFERNLDMAFPQRGTQFDLDL
ncbi:P63C domain-containing protein [Sinorhizobium meliloti]|uniref:P63C domain-containing protein n=1 Tax=Rhizobium meliloti TaxID=382 RepID=UPI000FD8911A|nr:P63C domain-containing protein [Sinorhizobium meliloti]MQU69082.1 hypothetical protein [Sinorhizobium meliloti]RVL12599.1 hypothetical protein CN149_14050 [Sinorhizobium meliloti]